MVAAVAAGVPAARADACLDEFRALFAGEMDGFSRKPYRSVKTVYGEDGKQQLVFDNIVETPFETISGNRGGPFGLVVDREVWTGPTMEGPWSPSPYPSTFPPDRKAAYEESKARQIAALGNTVCLGEVELEGRTYLHYEFSRLPPENKAAAPMWFAESDKVWLDPASKQVARWEMTDFQTSFLPGISKERHVEVFSYDDSIRVDPPE
ncbi:hypothetical protein [Hoeflea marina]|nr:hypothetical protein [Hoeflea marina]